MNTNVGEKIKFYRQQRGYTQKKLGELCGMADSAIRRYESGRANPKIETLAKIANALDCNIIDLDDSLKAGYNELQESKKNIHSSLKQITESLNYSLDVPLLVKETFDNDPDVVELINTFRNDETVLLNSFNRLNSVGKEKALEYTDMLTKLPDYTKGSEEP